MSRIDHLGEPINPGTCVSCDFETAFRAPCGRCIMCFLDDAPRELRAAWGYDRADFSIGDEGTAQNAKD